MKKGKTKDYKLYNILSPFLVFLAKVFRRLSYENIEYIPEGPCIFAGNHTSEMDFSKLMGCSKRVIRFIAKKEIFSSKFGNYLFTNMGVIPVNRRRDTDTETESENKKAFNSESINKAVLSLKNGCCIAIFPEGTVNKTDNIVLPFKIGAVKMAKDANVPIVPFAIKAKHKYIGKVKVIFAKPIYVKKDLEKERANLEKTVSEMLK